MNITEKTLYTLEFDKIRELPYKVYNADGVDVTNDYYLKIEGKGIRVTPRTLTITSASETKEYDGTALTNPDVSITLGTLVAGHTLHAEAIGSITDVGITENGIDNIEILDSAGKDVTQNYDIDPIYGKLIVIDDE